MTNGEPPAKFRAVSIAGAHVANGGPRSMLSGPSAP
jgi:hypothetical protein